jgi:pyrroline-5-carboxylate reductase
MGGALAAGWLQHGVERGAIFIQDPAPTAEAVKFLKSHRLKAAAKPRLPADPAVIVLAVKPQIASDVLAGLASRIGKKTVLLSIAAGRTLLSLAAPLPDGTAIVRAMPNTPAAIGRGVTVACANEQVSATQKRLCAKLLEAVGAVEFIDDEALMDAVTAVSGSGPAYVFLLAECLAEAGEEAGLPPDLAARLARETVAGAGELLHRSSLAPSTLRENVTSPNGTTAAALSVLMGKGGFTSLLRRAVKAAAKRSRELSK